MTNEPIPPVRCERHGDDWVEITNFGQHRRRFICNECGGGRDTPADVLYAEALASYEQRRAEYDRLTPRILELEAELQRR